MDFKKWKTKTNSELFPKSIFNVFFYGLLICILLLLEWEEIIYLREKLCGIFTRIYYLYLGILWEAQWWPNKVRNASEHWLELKECSSMWSYRITRRTIFRESNFFAHILISWKFQIIRINVLKIKTILIQKCIREAG